MTVRYGLEDRTVLLTGAAGGIGRALARAFAAQGARLLLVDREAAAYAGLQAGYAFLSEAKLLELQRKQRGKSN